jgi:hypothetical protein
VAGRSPRRTRPSRAELELEDAGGGPGIRASGSSYGTTGGSVSILDASTSPLRAALCGWGRAGQGLNSKGVQQLTTANVQSGVAHVIHVTGRYQTA